MGASSSTEQKVPAEQRDAETIASSTGALPMLQKAFSTLSDPQTGALPLSALKKCLCIADGIPTCEAPGMPDCFPGSLGHLGDSIVDIFFVPEKGGVSWIEFLRGYVKCCGRTSTSMSLNTLFRVFAATTTKAGLASKLEFESDDADGKISGNLVPADVQMLLWLCWIMSWHSRTSKISTGQSKLCLPDIDNLVLSAIVSCAEMSSHLSFSDCNFSELDIQLPVQKVVAWVLTTVPCLTDCFVKYVNKRLQESVTLEDASEPSSSFSADIPSTDVLNTYLLTPGRAWAISLALRSTISEEVLKACEPSNAGPDESLLYRSSVHGKGLNRLWSNIEGYQGPSLMLISASSGDADDNVKKWIIGALVHQGYESRDVFYGSSGHLFSLSPLFHVFSPSGKEKNFVYSHVRPTLRAYERNPKPVGIAFGGTIGNERVFIDEDFAKITIRHHAADKTYQSGSLFPDQGYLTVEGSISEVEVWGLGGEVAKKVQESLKQREQLFTEQRRTIDLKTFTNWEDSPEKMMMDMISNPNSVKREER